MIIKFAYALIWQEEVFGFSNESVIFDPEYNILGAELLPVVNEIANGLSSFPVYDENLIVRN